MTKGDVRLRSSLLAQMASQLCWGQQWVTQPRGLLRTEKWLPRFLSQLQHQQLTTWWHLKRYQTCQMLPTQKCRSTWNLDPFGRWWFVCALCSIVLITELLACGSLLNQEVLNWTWIKGRSQTWTLHGQLITTHLELRDVARSQGQKWVCPQNLPALWPWIWMAQEVG